MWRNYIWPFLVLLGAGPLVMRTFWRPLYDRFLDQSFLLTCAVLAAFIVALTRDAIVHRAHGLREKVAYGLLMAAGIMPFMGEVLVAADILPLGFFPLPQWVQFATFLIAFDLVVWYRS